MTRKGWVLVAAIVLVAVATVSAVVLTGDHTTSVAQATSTSTATVDRGTLSAVVSLTGNLTYRARSDGSPYSVINQARGTYTALPDAGVDAHCGDVLYRVDDRPVLLLCGAVPAYRDLHQGDAGNDVRQLNQNLRDLGRAGGIDPADNQFTEVTKQALETLQHDKGLDVSGQLRLGDAVFLPDSVRIAKLSGALGGSALPGAPVLYATSDMLEVRVDLEPLQQGSVPQGASARIALPGNRSVTGKVDRIGRVAQSPAGANNTAQNNSPGNATIPAYISLDDPRMVAGLDQAPVRVEITTDGVDNVLSVPVTAIVGKSGGGFAVEVVRDGGRRELVAAEVGLFDTTAGRVEVTGDLREGDQVVVPSL